MTPSLQGLGIDRLSIEQRTALAQEILDSVVAQSSPPPLSEAKRQELDRRLAEHTLPGTGKGLAARTWTRRAPLRAASEFRRTTSPSGRSW
jgi:putative addiction module component (TIGR02574 family)